MTFQAERTSPWASRPSRVKSFPDEIVGVGFGAAILDDELLHVMLSLSQLSIPRTAFPVIFLNCGRVMLGEHTHLSSGANYVSGCRTHQKNECEPASKSFF